MLCNLIFVIFLEFFTKDYFYLICTLEVDPTAPSWIRSPFLCLEMWELERRSTRGCTNREENSFAAKNASGRILEAFFCSLLDLLGRLSSVDTIWFSVDTLSRPVDRVHWELGLVSTLLDLVSTLLDHFFIFWLRAWSIVSTPVWGVSTLPLEEFSTEASAKVPINLLNLEGTLKNQGLYGAAAARSALLGFALPWLAAAPRVGGGASLPPWKGPPRVLATILLQD
ncbi:hypothetical protein Taro_021521 [Colocasia esculenta]|uniref:Uncharacterized protein n=1 Tax=Colocasia esculenta TaxID=4460 RepID=A0A843V8F0_COLES|nr:hypothetical protein [Colocasia esculenta]